MKIELHLGEASMAVLVPALLRAAEKEGLLVAADEAGDPLTLAEVARRGKISQMSVRRLIEAGTLKKVRGTGRVLVTAESFDQWRKA